jgi:MbtH protein
MDIDEREDKAIYKVVVDHEEQYSIWPADRENPLGWTDAGKTGTKEECLEYLKEEGKGTRADSPGKEAERRASEDETGGERGDL